MSVWRMGREAPSGLAVQDDWVGWNFLEESGKTCRTGMGKDGVWGWAQERQLVAVLASAGLSWGRGEGL